jgi:hypothetical protein
MGGDYIAFGDAATRAAAWNSSYINTNLFGDIAGDWRCCNTLWCGWCWRCWLCGWCRWCRWCGGSTRLFAGYADDAQDFTNADGGTFGLQDLRQNPSLIGGHFNTNFIGFEFDQCFTSRNRIAHTFEPLANRRLDDRLTQCWYLNVG